MKNSIFREESINKVSSPEELNDYIKVSNPGMWLILSGVIILLIGICVWGAFGHLDTTIISGAVCSDGIMTCYIKESDIDSVEKGMTVSAGGNEYVISAVSSAPQQLTEDIDPYVLHIGSLESGEWAYTATFEVKTDDGVYEAIITTESISPMSFIIN